ncbi:TPA: DUF2946 family protein [Pseudomonas aeruginosa]|uniref:DUF2946 family protein n=1 Tax=Pseudomonas aeruginosa TaxID=287 RepID=UPI000FC42E16|nr:DUF2946 family protein [Pseudomonas aeruginosa]RUB88283.1 DUF2946 domain-containing protein [Pseudomonas aeruginosa]HCT8655793.1 DUF2946 family protein [Pseudomonas aeruginosa]HEP8987186.1 DUF2946 family protein [Pseudomonas aeruginosa]
MPLSRRPLAWLASLAVLMNLFVVPLSQALTTQERASLLLGGFCSTSSDSLLRLKLGAALKDIDLPDDHESLAPHLCCCAGAAGTPGLVASWPALPLAPLASPARNALSATDLPPLRYWRLANPRASPVA